MPRRRPLDWAKRIIEIFKQPQYSPIPVEVQVAVIWAVQNGYVDDVPVNRVKEFQAKLTESWHDANRIAYEDCAEKVMNPALTTELKAAADQFKETWR